MSEVKKIFITEDEFIVSKNLESKLKTLGYEVTGTSPSGEEAIQKIRKNPPDIVLMDIMLAGEMDGIETAKMIRSEFDIPVIFLTAYSSEEIYRRAALAEPYAYIIKPYEERELEINIAIALYKSNIEREYARKQIELEELNDNLDRLVEERTQKLLKEIRERKEAQELQQRFFNVIEQSSDHVMITNENGVIEYANPAMCAYTLYDKNEVIGQKPSIFKSNMYDDSYYTQLWSTITKGRAFSDEFVNKKKNGDLYTVAQVILPLKNLEGRITHFASVSRDFTEKKKFEKKLMDVQEDERARISRELHDGIGQSVAAIKLGINRIVEKYKIPENEFSETMNLIESLTASVREISYDLMPSVLRDYGLIAATSKVIQQIEKNTHIDIFFRHDEEKRLPQDMELSLFRIIQEALNNSIKYSGASKIQLSLACMDEKVLLDVIDNGHGFDYKNVMEVSGQGIRNMKHRAHLMNGVFQLQSSEDGTEINVRIPFKKC
ncbi:response regulator [Paracrocinitomix mangrovi]|uniref:response regulator n=1 Tax=Paracrocinitomix mangrovi TaxID=2862509 RepID=UPI001C8D4111|nr:response regulator [Paracrocinitomix mangrovi]UKN01596.1 response regulator [Paracrocinitomix mangrovi]